MTLHQEGRSKSLGDCVSPSPLHPHPANHCPTPTVMFPESTRRKGQEGYVRTCRGLKSLDLIVFIFLLPVPAALAPSAPHSTPRRHHNHSCPKDRPSPEPAHGGPGEQPWGVENGAARTPPCALVGVLGCVSRTEKGPGDMTEALALEVIPQPVNLGI